MPDLKLTAYFFNILKYKNRLCGRDPALTAYFFRVRNIEIEPSGRIQHLTAYFSINKKAPNSDFVCRQTAYGYGRLKVGFQHLEKVCRET